jgi:hypothetical protein
MKKFFDKIAAWINAFYANDNRINEQSVVGTYWAFITTLLLFFHVAKIGQVGIDVLVLAASAMLLSFGIAGLKKPGL